MAKKKVSVCNKCQNQGYYLVGLFRHRVVQCAECEKKRTAAFEREIRNLKCSIADLSSVSELRKKEWDSKAKEAEDRVRREATIKLKEISEYASGMMHQLMQFKPMLDDYRAEKSKYPDESKLEYSRRWYAENIAHTDLAITNGEAKRA